MGFMQALVLIGFFFFTPSKFLAGFPFAFVFKTEGEKLYEIKTSKGGCLLCSYKTGDRVYEQSDSKVFNGASGEWIKNFCQPEVISKARDEMV